METVFVHGEAFALEERMCAGGCALRFKVQPSSQQIFARQNCKQICFGEKWVGKQKKEKTAVVPENCNTASRAKVVDGRIAEMRIEFWKSCVKEASRFADSKALSYADKMEIAAWAHAGVKMLHDKSMDAGLKHFSECTKIDLSSLSRWVKIKLVVAPHIEDTECDDEAALLALADKVETGMSKDQVRGLIRDSLRLRYQKDLNEGLSSLTKFRDLLSKAGVGVSIMEEKDLAKLKAVLADMVNRVNDVNNKRLVGK